MFLQFLRREFAERGPVSLPLKRKERHEGDIKNEEDEVAFLAIEQLSASLGNEHSSVCSLLADTFDTAQADARYSILTNVDGDISAVHNLLRKFANVASTFGPKGLSEEILFATHMLRGLGYCG